MTSPRARTDARTASPPSRPRRRHRLILSIAAVAVLALALATGASAASTAYVGGVGPHEGALLPIDLSDNTLGTEILLPGASPNAVVVSPDDKTVYGIGENLETEGTYVVPVDTETNVAATPMISSPVGEPKGAAISPDGKTMYVAVGHNGILPVNLESGTFGTVIGLPGETSYGATGGIVFSPDGTKAYVASFNKIFIIDVATGTPEGEPASPVENVLFGSPRHLAISPDGTKVWDASESPWLLPFETGTGAFAARVNTPASATNVAYTRDGATLWSLATGNGASKLLSVDPSTSTIGSEISFASSAMTVESFGNGLAISPNGKTAYVSSARKFAAVNLGAGTVGTPIELPIYSTAMAVSSIVNPAGAATPTITAAPPTQSGVVGDPTNPTMTIKVGQIDENGAPVPPEELQVTATTENAPASISAAPHLPAANVTITGTGEERVVHFDPVAPGISFVTLTVSGVGGKSAAITFTYAISMETTPTSRIMEGGSDASTAIDAGEGDLLVADDELSFIKLYDAEHSGAPLREYDIGFSNTHEVDFESSARVGNTIYWLGSHGNTKKGIADPARQEVIATEVTGSGDKTQLTATGEYGGLLRDMLAWDKDRQTRGEGLGIYRGPVSSFNSSESSVNIEGAEFAPNSHSELYLGMREPMEEVDGKQDALIVPVTNINRLVEGTETQAKFAEPILLDLDGMAIREMRKNAAGQYLILGGVYGNFGRTLEEALFSWTGERGDKPVRLTTALPQSEEAFADEPGAWEGIGQMPAELTSGTQVRLIMDQGETRPYEPDEHTKSKQMTNMQNRKSRTDLFTLSGNVGAAVSAPAPTFPAQAANTVGAGAWVTVTNTGAQKLVVDGVHTADSDGVSAGDFLVSQDQCAGRTIAVGGTCKVQVRFAPSRADTTSNAALVFEGNVDSGASSVPLAASSTALPAGATGPSGPAGDNGADGKNGTDGIDGKNGIGIQGPVGPKGDAGPQGERGAPGKSGTVSFTPDRAQAQVGRGGKAGLVFVLRNATAAALPGGSATASPPHGLKAAGRRTVAVPGLGAGHSRKVVLRLKIARDTPVGTYKVPVELTVAGHSVTATVSLKVHR